jgi:hypothetical protein
VVVRPRQADHVLREQRRRANAPAEWRSPQAARLSRIRQKWPVRCAGMPSASASAALQSLNVRRQANWKRTPFEAHPVLGACERLKTP